MKNSVYPLIVVILVQSIYGQIDSLDYEDRWIPLVNNRRVDDIHYHNNEKTGGLNFWQFEKQPSFPRQEYPSSRSLELDDPFSNYIPQRQTPLQRRIFVKHSQRINIPPFTTVFQKNRIIPHKPPRGRRPKPNGNRNNSNKPPHQQYAPAFISYGPIHGPPPPPPAHNKQQLPTHYDKTQQTNPQYSAPPIPPPTYNQQPTYQPMQSYSNAPIPVTSYSNVAPTYGPPIQTTTNRVVNYPKPTYGPPSQASTTREFQHPKPTYGPPIRLQQQNNRPRAPKSMYDSPQKMVLSHQWYQSSPMRNQNNQSPRPTYIPPSNGWTSTAPSNSYIPPTQGWSSTAPTNSYAPSKNGWNANPPQNAYVPPKNGWDSSPPQNAYVPPKNGWDSSRQSNSHASSKSGWTSSTQSNYYIPPMNSWSDTTTPSNTYIPPHQYRPASQRQSASYEPPMNFGQPMHNFGPPKSSYGQPPPIMGDPHYDIYAPKEDIYRYPTGDDERHRYDNNYYGDMYNSGSMSGENSVYEKPSLDVYQVPRKSYKSSYKKKSSSSKSKSKTKLENNNDYYTTTTPSPPIITTYHDDPNARPAPNYDTNYNSPGLYKDPKIVDWMPYSGKNYHEVVNRGSKYKVISPRYRTLPDSLSDHEPDPEHENYPKLTYDSLDKRSSSSVPVTSSIIVKPKKS